MKAKKAAAAAALATLAAATGFVPAAAATAARTAVGIAPPPVLAWGDNAYGELGDGTTNQHLTPSPAALPAGTIVTQVAAGVGFSLALTSTGTVLAWGNNGSGQLGDGTTTSSVSPVTVALPAGTTAVQISAGAYSGYAVTSTGGVFGWGDNSSGELGNGSISAAQPTPVAASLGSSIVTQVSAGGTSVLARVSNGSALAWGSNFAGQLGIGNTLDAPFPTPVSLLAGVTVKQVAAGGADGYAITSTGSVLGWGFNSVGQIGNGTQGTNYSTPVAVALPAGVTAAQLAAGNGFALARTTAGGLLSWGLGANGALGGGNLNNQATPTPVSLPAGVLPADISAGGGWAFLTTAAGTAYGWGSNSYGTLGDGTTTNRSTPTAVSLPASAFVTHVVAGGGQHSLATMLPPPTVTSVAPPFGVTGGGTSVTITGTNFNAATAVLFGATQATGFTVNSATRITATAPPGTGTVDATVIGPGGQSAVTGTDRFSYLHTGSVLGWGADNYGERGDGRPGSTQLTPAPATAVQNLTFASVAAGTTFSIGRTTGGAVYAWGNNNLGQLGVGNLLPSQTPVKVALPAAVTVKAIAAGESSGYALTTTGLVYAWGDNLYGSVGDGVAINYETTPKLVAFPAGTVIAAITSEFMTPLALTSTGKVFAWGYNLTGQVGDNTTLNRLSPVAVKLPAGVVVKQVAAGALHSVAVTSTGSVLAWGSNLHANLGDGTATDRHIPVTAQLPAGVTAVAAGAGYDDTFVVTSTGSVLAWGNNQYGELGNGTFAASASPVAVHLPAGTRVAKVIASYYGAFALTASGSLFSWGYDANADLGNGTVVLAGNPVPGNVRLPAGTVVTSFAVSSQHAQAVVSPAPAVTAVSPAAGIVAGGMRITITGARFTPGSIVTVGGTAATAFTFISNTQILVTTPAHAAGITDVRVTNGNGTSPVVAADHFTYQ